MGRVLGLLGRPQEAARELAQVVREDETFIAYHGQMFLAHVRELEGNLTEAEERYRAALARVPSAHAARVGLSHLMETGGDRSGAIEVLAGESGADPWREYLAGPARHAPDYLAELRAAAAKGATNEGVRR